MVVGAADVVVGAAVVVVGTAVVVVGAAVVVVGAAAQQQILVYSANNRNCKAIRTKSCLKVRSSESIYSTAIHATNRATCSYQERC